MAPGASERELKICNSISHFLTTSASWSPRRALCVYLVPLPDNPGRVLLWLSLLLGTHLASVNSGAGQRKSTFCFLDLQISKKFGSKIPSQCPLSSFLEIATNPRWSFFLNCFSPLLFALNPFCSKLNPFFLALPLLTNENNSSPCSWWLHVWYLWTRIISFFSLLS